MSASQPEEIRYSSQAPDRRRKGHRPAGGTAPKHGATGGSLDGSVVVSGPIGIELFRIANDKGGNHSLIFMIEEVTVKDCLAC